MHYTTSSELPFSTHTQVYTLGECGGVQGGWCDLGEKGGLDRIQVGTGIQGHLGISICVLNELVGSFLY